MDIDDIFSEPAAANARAGGKFRPRAKPVLRQGTSGEVHSSHSNVVTEEPFTSVPNISDKMQFVRSLGTGDTCGDPHSSFGRSTGENADIFSGLECLDDFLRQSSSGTVSNKTKLQDADVGTQPDNGLPVSCAVNTDAGDFLSSRELPAHQGEAPSLVIQDPIIWTNSSDGNLHSDNSILQMEEAGAFVDLEPLDIMSEIPTAAGRRTGKFQPKPKLKSKLQTGEEKAGANIPQADAVTCNMHPPNSQSVPSEMECIDEGSIPAFQTDDILDYTSMSFDAHTNQDITTSELPTNEELRKDTSHSDGAVFGDLLHSENVPETSEELSSENKKRKASAVSGLSQKSGKSSLTTEHPEDGKTSSQLRKRVSAREWIDEPEDPGEGPGNSDVNEDNNSEYTVEGKSQKSGRKSKKPATEKEKPVRKREKVNEAPDQSSQEPPKKFSCSTRRRRKLDQTLLETPEEEMRFLPFKDMILLAEHREQLVKKEAKASQVPSANKSTEFASREEDSQTEEIFTSESTDNRANYKFQSSSFLLNYQSFMKKEPRSRWSKQETELFYEAVQQFGSDLSMIQQLFPEKSRHQIKLKYKKEERQHPLRLSEALANRAKDHSHFERVIEMLKKVDGQAKEESNEDESAGVMHDEEDLTPETTTEGVAKFKPEDVPVEGGEADNGDIDVDLKYEETDDDKDDDIWNSYRSEI